LEYPSQASSVSLKPTWLGLAPPRRWSIRRGDALGLEETGMYIRGLDSADTVDWTANRLRRLVVRTAQGGVSSSFSLLCAIYFHHLHSLHKV
jgi:hypothetical protein